MATIDRWVLVDEDGTEADYEYASYDGALGNAQRLGHAVVERHYVYEDSELVWAPGGAQSWPPSRLGPGLPTRRRR